MKQGIFLWQPRRIVYGKEKIDINLNRVKTHLIIIGEKYYENI